MIKTNKVQDLPSEILKRTIGFHGGVVALILVSLRIAEDVVCDVILAPCKVFRCCKCVRRLYVLKVDAGVYKVFAKRLAHA